MKSDYTPEERYYKAQKRVEEIKIFYQHLTVYVICNPIVIVVNIVTSPGYLWCLWCLFGWAVPIILHGLTAFNYLPFFNKEWEEKKIAEILDKENSKQIWK